MTGRVRRCEQDGNLPEWAIDADPSSGVIDMYAGPSKEAMAVFPARTVSLPDGRTAFSLTMFQAPDMPDELFESQHESLKREFANIARRFNHR